MTIKKGYVDTRDGQIHYRYTTAGEGVPIVFFHQTASSSQSYEKLMELLVGRYPLFALDTPGFGQSFFPPKAPTTAYYVDTLFDALSGLGVDRFHAFGHHTGAAIAAEMAATAPGRVVTLMMDGPVWLSADERRQWMETAIDPMVIKPDGSHLMKIWERVVGLDPDHPPALCHREALDTLRAGERWHEAYIAVFQQDSHAVYDGITCPMLLLCGEHDVLMPYFEPLCNAYPRAARYVLKNCGTYAIDNGADQIADRISDFLKTI